MKNIIRLILAGVVIVYLFIYIGDIVPSAEEKGYVCTGDFNGDGMIDTVKLLSYGIFNPPKLYETINPWSGERLKEGEHKVLLIAHQGEELRYLVHDSSFFATPIWQTEKPPVSVYTKGSKSYAYAENIPGLNSDGIVLGTEAGIDILLYWNGSTYVLYWPDEEP